MTEDGNWLQSLSGLGGLPKLVVDRVCNAIGMVYEPTHIRRIARAEADRKRILAEGDIDVTDIRTRAVHRAEAEQVRQQHTIEDVIRQALPHLTNAAEPSKVTDDWLIHFFGLARDVTREEMRKTWGRILAGEFNRPGSLSRRTLNIAAQIDARDASLFNTLCCFAVVIGSDHLPLVFDINAAVYSNSGITFAGLSDLDGLGLVKFDNVVDYTMRQLPRMMGMWYQRRFMTLQFPKDFDNVLPLGKVMLTGPGRELAAVCDTLPVNGFDEYLTARLGKYSITAVFLDPQTPAGAVPAPSLL